MDDILIFAQKLLTIRSTADNPKGMDDILHVITDELAEKFKIEQFADKTIPSLLIHNQTKPIKNYKLILNAHLDVVPAATEQFEPYIKEGRLYGRGTYDMKAAGAVMILLFKELAEKVSYPLALQLVTDEETGGFHGTKYQIEQGIRSEFVIAGENTNLAINNKAKGVLRTQMHVSGKTAHGAYPWLGENALIKLNHALEELLNAFPIPDVASWQTTINVAKIETSNTTYNKVPDQATAWLDIRFIPEEKESILEKIKTVLPDDFIIDIVFQEPGQVCNENDPHIEKLKKIIQNVSHQPAEMLSTHGSSDVRFYNQVNCAAICFGPRGSGHHADEEWVDIKSLGDYYTILKEFLLAIDKK